MTVKQYWCDFYIEGKRAINIKLNPYHTSDYIYQDICAIPIRYPADIKNMKNNELVLRGCASGTINVRNGVDLKTNY